MRKFYLILLLFLIAHYTSFSQQQPTIAKITHTYFRSDPFQNEFSSFVSHLLNDPTITNRILEKKTDTSLFYFEGNYTNHSPFFFKPTRLKVALYETAIPSLDSLPADTIYTYQLLAYDTSSKEGIQEVKKEFDKIFRRYKNSFYNNQLTLNPGGDKLEGETYNFFTAFHAVSPFSLTWLGPDSNKEMCLVLTVRIDNYNNRTVLPIPFYAPK